MHLKRYGKDVLRWSQTQSCMDINSPKKAEDGGRSSAGSDGGESEIISVHEQNWHLEKAGEEG